jgi:hypothetical protein
MLDGNLSLFGAAGAEPAAGLPQFRRGGRDSFKQVPNL